MSVSAVKLHTPNCFSHMLHTKHRIFVIILHVLPIVLSNFSNAHVVYNICGRPLFVRIGEHVTDIKKGLKGQYIQILLSLPKGSDFPHANGN